MVAPGQSSAPKARELGSLTGLRAVAASAVFVRHIEHWVGGTSIGDAWRSVHYVAICGVVSFFVLSGFLLAQPGAQRGGLGGFWLRRAARILPVYWLSLLVMTAFTVYFDDSNPLLRPLNVLANVLLVQSWGPRGTEASINLPAWSLSVEVLFYALLPLLIGPLRRVITGAPAWTLAALVVLTQLGAVAIHQGWVTSAFPPAYLPVFLLGVHAAVQPARWQRVRPLLAAGVVAVALALSVPFDYFGVAAVALTILIGALANADREGRGGALARLSARRFGVWSYAFFLLHVPVGIVLVKFVSAPTNAVIGIGFAVLQFALSWLAAAIVFHYWEEPARRGLTRRQPAAV